MKALTNFLGIDGNAGRARRPRLRLDLHDTAIYAVGDVHGCLDELLALERAVVNDAEDLPALFDAPELGVTRWGTLRVDRDMMTNMDGVFAAGDIVRGASLVVWAIRDGRDVSETMHAWLKEKARSAKVAA